MAGIDLAMPASRDIAVDETNQILTNVAESAKWEKILG